MKKLIPVILLVVAMIMLLLPAPVSAAVTTTYSSNWAGYIATASGSSLFTSASASWTVPTVASTPKPAFSSAWVGIGGVFRNGSKLIQAGPEQDVNSDGTKTYSAWYEIFPQFPVTVGTVSPSDDIFVSITRLEGKPQRWNITMTKNGTEILDKDFKVNPNFASQASAEFIVERPLLVVGHQTAPLADFGSVTFDNCSTSLGGLSSLTTVTEMIMTSNGTSSGTILATPNDSLSGNSFTVDYD